MLHQPVCTQTAHQNRREHRRDSGEQAVEDVARKRHGGGGKRSQQIREIAQRRLLHDEARRIEVEFIQRHQRAADHCEQRQRADHHHQAEEDVQHHPREGRPMHPNALSADFEGYRRHVSHSFLILFPDKNAPRCAANFCVLANTNETQRSSATLSGMSGRQNQKGASRWRRRIQKSYWRKNAWI